MTLARAASVCRLPVEGGLLLLDPASGSLLAYNDSAREVWELLEDGRSDGDLVADFAGKYELPLEVARSDVQAILDDWQSRGVLASSAKPHAAKAQSPAKAEFDWKRKAPTSWSSEATYRVRGKVFEFAVEAGARPRFGMMFGHLEAPGAKPDVRLEVRDAGEGETALVVDGVERVRTKDGGLLIGAVHQCILEHIRPGVEWLALAHGGAVARDGKATILSAACGGGKSTMNAYLVAREGYTYLADDLIALSAPAGKAVPWPLPLSLKEGSWDVLADTYRGMESFPRYRTARGESRQIIPEPSAWDIEPVPVRTILFPSYVAGATPQLTAITPFEALQRLLSDRIWLGYPVKEACVTAFLDWLDRTPAYTLVHGNVADAAVRLREIM
jgi:coenzyme PQQ synthesis protein D (PqqD)